MARITVSLPAGADHSVLFESGHRDERGRFVTMHKHLLPGGKSFDMEMHAGRELRMHRVAADADLGDVMTVG